MRLFHVYWMSHDVTICSGRLFRLQNLIHRRSLMFFVSFRGRPLCQRMLDDI